MEKLLKEFIWKTVSVAFVSKPRFCPISFVSAARFCPDKLFQ
jgi:hypothetical protein